MRWSRGSRCSCSLAATSICAGGCESPCGPGAVIPTRRPGADQIDGSIRAPVHVLPAPGGPWMPRTPPSSASGDPASRSATGLAGLPIARASAPAGAAGFTAQQDAPGAARWAFGRRCRGRVTDSAGAESGALLASVWYRGLSGMSAARGDGRSWLDAPAQGRACRRCSMAIDGAGLLPSVGRVRLLDHRRCHGLSPRREPSSPAGGNAVAAERPIPRPGGSRCRAFELRGRRWLRARRSVVDGRLPHPVPKTPPYAAVLASMPIDDSARAATSCSSAERRARH